MLLKKELILVPVAILAMTLVNSNTLYAQGATATKERIKEIKFIKEDFNVEKLIRNNTTKIASTTNNYFNRTSIITSRSMDVTRKASQEETIEASVENKQENTEIEVKKETKKVDNKKNKKSDNAKTTKTNIKEKAEKKVKTENKTEVKKAKKKKENKKTEIKDETKNVEQNTETKSTGKIKVSISRNMDLTKRTGLSKEQFKKLIKHVSQDSSKFFYNNADTIYDLCAKYQINEIFFCGLISAESGWNIAGNHRRTHNYVSLMSGGKLINYSSVNEGLTVAAKVLHNNYLTPKGKFYGGKTLAGVQKKYCPSGSWINLVYGRMNDIVRAAKKIK